MDIVLVEPEIPQNTGNIARTCAATGTGLHLVRPLGFSTSDRYLKRAGLDYWRSVQVFYHDSYSDLRKTFPNRPFYFASVRGGRFYTEVVYPHNGFLVFGKETKGLPEALLEANASHCVRVPMLPGTRSLNLANSAAVVLFEALRQQGFPGLV